jgi:hypothetical protein
LGFWWITPVVWIETISSSFFGEKTGLLFKKQQVWAQENPFAGSCC